MRLAKQATARIGHFPLTEPWDIMI